MTLTRHQKTGSVLGDPDPKAEEYLLKAMSYLYESPTAKAILDALEKSDKQFYVFVQQGCNAMFVHEEVARQHGFDGGVIIWDPVSTITAFAGDTPTMQSPAIALIHEAGHAYQWLKKNGWFMANVAQALGGSTEHKLNIENDNITSNETPVAKELKEGTRKDYDASAPFGPAKRNYKAPYPLLPLGHG